MEEVVSALIDNWKPCALEGYATPKFEIPVKKSNNYEAYKRQELSRVLAFIEYAQKKRIKGGCTAMPIPSTSRKNLMIWGYPKATMLRTCKPAEGKRIFEDAERIYREMTE
jgi:hypothetical protein